MVKLCLVWKFSQIFVPFSFSNQEYYVEMNRKGWLWTEKTIINDSFSILPTMIGSEGNSSFYPVKHCQGGYLYRVQRLVYWKSCRPNESWKISCWWGFPGGEYGGICRGWEQWGNWVCNWYLQNMWKFLSSKLISEKLNFWFLFPFFFPFPNSQAYFLVGSSNFIVSIIDHLWLQIMKIVLSYGFLKTWSDFCVLGYYSSADSFLVDNF